MKETGFLVIVFLAGILIGIVAAGTTGYRFGQYDALCSEWHYMRVVAPDGSYSFVRLATPTTRPVEVHP